MPMPNYQIQGVPQLQQQQGPLGALTEFAKGEALSRGLDAAFPGAGLAKDAATAVAGTYLNKGGPLGAAYYNLGDYASFDDWIATTPLAGRPDHDGYGLYRGVWDRYQAAQPKGDKTEIPADVKKEVVKSALEKAKPQASPQERWRADWDVPIGHALGADWSTSGHYSDKDIGRDDWKAGVKASWKFNEGGGVFSDLKKTIWGDPEKNAKIKADRAAARQGIRENIKKKSGPSKGDVGSVLGSLLSAGFFSKGGPAKPAYKEMGGMTEGPLGMTDMLAAGKGKDVSKVVYKKKGGDIEDTMEIAYHAPLAAKPQGDK